MTQPRLATQTEHGRMYARADGGEPEVPSITTVIGQQATDLGGWHGYMAAKAVLEDDRALRAGRSAGLRHAVIRDAALAAERYRDQAAARGDRVHAYCEAVALRAMGREHDVEGARRFGVPAILVGWGYGPDDERDRADAVAHTPDQLDRMAREMLGL